MHWRLNLGSALVPLAMLAGLALVASAPAQGKEDEKAVVAEGKPAPDITLPAVNVEKALPDKKDAKTLGLKELRGKNVVTFLTITP